MWGTFIKRSETCYVEAKCHQYWRKFCIPHAISNPKIQVTCLVCTARNHIGGFSLPSRPYIYIYNFFNWYSGGGGVQLGPLGTVSINRPIFPAPGDYDDGEIGGMIGKGNWSTRRKLAPHATVSTNPTCCLDANPGRCGGKLVNNRLSYGTASVYIKLLLWKCILELLNEAVSSSNIASGEGWKMNDELERIWKEVVLP
jgi:hypothetical protein